MYLFLVRHFNDIDHITPVAWKMKTDGYPVAVYCMNPRYDIANDYRLEFLKSQGAAVDYLHTAYRQGDPFYKFLQWLMNKSFGIQASVRTQNRRPADISSKVFEQLARISGKHAYKLMRKMYYHAGWAQSILEQTAARVVCFDYVMPRLYVVDAFLKAAKEMSVPTLSLPHGIQLYTNEVTKPKSTDTRRFTNSTVSTILLHPISCEKRFSLNPELTVKKLPCSAAPDTAVNGWNKIKKLCPK